MTPLQGTPDSPLAGHFAFRIIIEGEIPANTKEQVIDWCNTNVSTSIFAGQHIANVHVQVAEVRVDSMGKPSLVKQ